MRVFISSFRYKQGLSLWRSRVRNFFYKRRRLKESTTLHLKQAFEMPLRSAPTGVREYVLIHISCHWFGPDEVSVSFTTPCRCQANSRSSAVYHVIDSEQQWWILLACLYSFNTDSHRMSRQCRCTWWRHTSSKFCTLLAFIYSPTYPENFSGTFVALKSLYLSLYSSGGTILKASNVNLPSSKWAQTRQIG